MTQKHNDSNPSYPYTYEGFEAEREWAQSVVEATLDEFVPILRKELFDAVLRGVRFGVMKERRDQAKLVADAVSDTPQK